jgi:hypothetical protein
VDPVVFSFRVKDEIAILSLKPQKVYQVGNAPREGEHGYLGAFYRDHTAHYGILLLESGHTLSS